MADEGERAAAAGPAGPRAGRRLRLDRAQRVVVVVGLGVALAAFGQWVTSVGGSGWVAYAPLSNAPFPPDVGMHPWARLLVWLALVAAWTGASVWLLRSAAPSSAEER